ncbi:hypothetical protein RhiJN_11934 [Ceratobasidium sp. AG-Ba]|nr:hypothetical protein RhiJN_11934 [Ceratobasidium sp. AG-Ba]
MRSGFRTQYWSVPEDVVRLRNDIVRSYQANPIPAFMDGNCHPIFPTNYTRFLLGSLVRVYFTVSHKVLRRKAPTLFFTATRPIGCAAGPYSGRPFSLQAPGQGEKADEPTAIKPTKRRRVN